MKISDFDSGGAYLKGADIAGKAVEVTINGAGPVELESFDDPDVKETKLAITFERASKSWIPNKTARTILANAYGDEIEGLKGRRVELSTTKVSVRGELKDSIIVRPLEDGSAAPPPYKGDATTRAVIQPEEGDGDAVPF